MLAAMRTLLLVAAAAGAAVPAVQDPANAEPTLRLAIVIDGVEHAATDGQELTVAIGGRQTKVKVSVAATRTFRAAGVEFEFPRDMGWSHESDESDTWTLDGDDVTVMVFRFGVGNPAEMAKDTLVAMQQSLDTDAKAPEPCTATLGGKEYAGLRGRMTIGDTATMETTAIGIARDKGCLLLLIQDSLDDDGKRSAQCTAMLEMLAKTFVLAAK